MGDEQDKTHRNDIACATIVLEQNRNENQSRIDCRESLTTLIRHMTLDQQVVIIDIRQGETYTLRN